MWALGVTTIYFYAYSTGRVLGLTAESYQNCMDCFYYQTFLYASESFTLVFLFYPMIAIFKELSVVFTAFVQVLVERHTNSHV